MAEIYRFFNSTHGDRRLYQASDYAEYFATFIESGVFETDESLRVNANETMVTTIKSGSAFIKGHMYHNTDNLNLTHDTADAINDRIDRIVLRLDNRIENRYIKAFVLKGTPSTTPEPPTLTRGEDVYELSLAQVRINAGKSFIEQSQIIDERFDEDVCGIATIAKNLQDEWLAWFDDLKGQSFVPYSKLKNGFDLDENENISVGTPLDYGRYESDNDKKNVKLVDVKRNNDGSFELENTPIISQLGANPQNGLPLSLNYGIGQRLLSEFTKNMTAIEWVELYASGINSNSKLRIDIFDETLNAVLATKTLLGTQIQPVGTGTRIVFDNKVNVIKGNIIQIRITGEHSDFASGFRYNNTNLQQGAHYIQTINNWSARTDSTTWDLYYRMKVDMDYATRGKVEKIIKSKNVEKWGNIRYNKVIDSGNDVKCIVNGMEMLLHKKEPLIYSNQTPIHASNMTMLTFDNKTTVSNALKLSIEVGRYNSPAGNLNIDVHEYNNDTLGKKVGALSVQANTVSTGYAMHDFTIPLIEQMSAGRTFAIILSAPNGNGTNYVFVRIYNSDGDNYYSSNNTDASWTDVPNKSPKYKVIRPMQNLLETTDTLVDLSHIDPALYPELQTVFELNRDNLDIQSPKLIDFSTTWRGNKYPLIDELFNVELSESASEIVFNVDEVLAGTSLFKFVIMLDLIGTDSGDNHLNIRLNDDSTANYNTNTIDSSGTTINVINQTATSAFILPSLLTSTQFTIGDIELPLGRNDNANLSTLFRYTNSSRTYNGNGRYSKADSLTKINKISLFPAKGQIRAGSRIKVLGVR